jgi:outer membrane receptor for ferrienterochelin and colicin
LSGPIVKKKTSFSFSTFGVNRFTAQRFLGTATSNADENAAPKLKNGINFSTLSVKHSLRDDHLLDFKYQINNLSFFRLGSFDLPERGSTLDNPRHKFSVTETGTFKKKSFNEIRFEFSKELRKITPESDDVTIIVLEAFSRGSSGIILRDEKTKFKFADNLLFDWRKHSLKLGTEIEHEKFQSVSENNLNGKFIFSSLSSFENQTPSQYSQTLGATTVNFSQSRAAFYAQDYFKLRKTLQLSLGLRL